MPVGTVRIAVVLPDSYKEKLKLHLNVARQVNGEFTVNASVQELRQMLLDNPEYCLWGLDGRPEIQLIHKYDF